MFRRPPDDPLEPPDELDRIVLRQAREAIKSDEPMKVFSGPRWSVPVALAATLLLAFTVVFQAGMPAKKAPTPEVTVQNVAQESVAAPPARSAVVEAASRERSMAGPRWMRPSWPTRANVPAWRSRCQDLDGGDTTIARRG